ncbi:MAG: glycosyltransferase family 2 protein [Ferruginibacter sp.]
MHNKPLISVILPVHNQQNYIEETIQSVLVQSFTDFEFIILDDGSTDKSAEIIKSYAKKDDRIKAYFEKNVGKSNATNNIIEKTTTELFAFLDADDVMMPDRLEKQLQFHRENPNANASSGHCNYINENGNLFGLQRYDGLRTIEDNEVARNSREFVTCSFTALMVTREAYVNAGGLSKRFEPCEDFEFINRLVNKGYNVLINPIVLMKYRIHPTSVTVKKPILIYDTISYVKYCFALRWDNQSEISFDEFQDIQKTYAWWTKFNRMRFNYSRIAFRKAGFAMLSRRYLSFAWQMATSLVLSPNYVLKKMTNFSKK